jgi:hypothetical protein
MGTKKRKMEQEIVEKELSLLMETTLRLEDELNSFIQMDRE